MIIDFHTHAFPDKISKKAMDSLAHCCGDVVPFHNGCVSSLTDYLDDNHIDKAVILNIATNPSQECKVNDFAISHVQSQRIIPFGSIHPESSNIDYELDRLKEAGIKGIKLHPDYQGFFVDEKRMMPIYEKLSRKGFITVFHSGVDIGYPNPVHCTPKALSSVLPCFQGAPVVAAHFGGYLLWQDTLKYLCGTDAFIDTSFSYSRIPPKYALAIIENHNTDKILFGSDMPWSGSDNETRFIESLELSEKARNKILFENAQRILNI